MKHRILITGGRGFVGGRLAHSLAARGDIELTLGSRIEHASLSWLPSVKVIAMDWSSQQSLMSACKGIDVLVLLAAINDAECLRDPTAALWDIT